MRKCKFKKSKMAAAAILNSSVYFNSINYSPILTKFQTMMQKVMCQKTAGHAGGLLSKLKMAVAIILDFTNLLPFHYY
jgi:hypothetical protein